MRRTEASPNRCIAALVALAGLAFAVPVLAAGTANDEPAAERASPSRGASDRPAVAIADGALSDAAITTRVKEKLERDPSLAGSRITVSTSGGVVSLTGHVRSEEQIAAVEAHASDDGVMRVDDRLAIQPR